VIFLEALLNYSSNPAYLALAIVVISWIWEDAAVISGALLASDEHMGIILALAAVFIGICSGDLALYYMGRLAHRWRSLRAWILTNPKSRSLSRKFRRRTATNILIIRFIPGLRTLGFTMCGLWRVSLHRFLMAMIGAGVVWVAIVFTAVYQLGSSDWLQNSYWKWALMGFALLLLIVNNLWAHRGRLKKAVG
jgi:membrane protein DedA with SNARE-associated domain